MLYLVQVNEWSKVGYTADRGTLIGRMQSYGTHCPGVQLIGVREGTRKDESRYRSSFNQYEDWGEWRKVPKDILDTIKEDFTPVSIQMKPATKTKQLYKTSEDKESIREVHRENSTLWQYNAITRSKKTR